MCHWYSFNSTQIDCQCCCLCVLCKIFKVAAVVRLYQYNHRYCYRLTGNTGQVTPCQPHLLPNAILTTVCWLRENPITCKSFTLVLN